MRLLKLIITATFIFVGLCLTAQTYMNPRFIGTPQPGTCNNTVVCEIYNVENHNNVQLTLGLDDYLQEVHHLDTIHNFCFGIEFMQDHTFTLLKSNGFHLSFFSRVPPALPKFEFNVVDYQAPTADTIRDGSLTIKFDSTITSSLLSTTFYDSEGMQATIVTTSTDDYTLRFDSLSEGALNYHMYDTIDGQDYMNQFCFGDFDMNIVDTGLQVSVNYQHSNGNCEGFIDVFATQTVPGSHIEIVWNDDSFENGLSRTNLCPGLYAFHAIERTQLERLYGYIDTVIITNSNASFIDSSLYNTVLDDTLTYQIENCSFDYNLPIDSVDYNLDTVSLSQGFLTGVFQLTIYQQQLTTHVEDSVYALVNANTLLDIVLYCNGNTSNFLETKTPIQDFQSKQLLILLNSNGVIHGDELKLAKQSHPTISIFPNPMVNELTIETGNSSIIDVIQLFDSQGEQKIFKTPKTSNVSLDVSTLSKGTYFLWYKTNDSWYQEKIVK